MQAYFRTLSPRAIDDIALGAGLSLLEARTKASAFSTLHEQHGDARAHLQAQDQAEAQREEQAKQLRAQHALERPLRERFALHALIGAYIRDLERQGKVSAADVRGLVGRHLLDAHPGLCARAVSAKDVAADRIVIHPPILDLTCLN